MMSKEELVRLLNEVQHEGRRYISEDEVLVVSNEEIADHILSAEGPLKTAALCARCLYDFEPHCQDKQGGSCNGCPLDLKEDCACLLVREGEPCRYYVERR